MLKRLLAGLARRCLLLLVRHDTTGLDNIDRDSSQPLVYVLLQPAISDLLVLDRECSASALPRPMHRQQLGNGQLQRSYFYLRPGGQWHRRRQRSYLDPLLQELVNRHGQRLRIVPVSVFWGQFPGRETSIWKLLLADSWAVSGRIRRLLQILLLGRKVRLEFSQPIELDQLLDGNMDQQRSQRLLHRLARVELRQARNAALGPDLSHRRTLVRSLLQEKPVQQAIASYSQEQQCSHAQAAKQALAYANEIASDYSHSAVRLLELLLNWFWNRFYSGIRLHNIEQVRQRAKGSTLVYVPCHRSHIDYLLLSYVLYQQGLGLPHVAAGINLNMPLAGTILRRCGAFFIRRSFRDNQLYTAVFNAYMQALCSRGHPLEYFIEGGRSRTGRMLQPRTGMLAVTLNSYQQSSRLPIVFVPVYIGYEKVLEGRTYLGELRGRSKKKESFFDLIRLLASIRKQNFGQVWLNFGQPLALPDFLAQQQAEPPGGQPAAPGRELARQLCQRINAAVAINPVNLVALAILATQRLAIDRKRLEQLLDSYLELLKLVPYSGFYTLPAGNGAEMVQACLQMQLLQQQDNELGAICYLDETNAVLMTYYRNNILHVFAVPALLASLFYSNARLNIDQIRLYCRALFPYLQAELFIHGDSRQLGQQLDKWLQAFVQTGLLRRRGQTYQRPDPSSGEFVLLGLLANSITQTLQRYYMCIALLLKHPQYSLDAGQLEQLSSKMAQRLSILHGINAPEFFDKNLFRLFIDSLLKRSILHLDEQQRLGYTHRLNSMAQSIAQKVLPAEVRLSIVQATQ